MADLVETVNGGRTCLRAPLTSKITIYGWSKAARSRPSRLAAADKGVVCGTLFHPRPGRRPMLSFDNQRSI
ncbi:MAG: hypothetical protein JWN52_2301 [Actinomycetia bacterium]|jgi:hypothetical protein|nr:hypothetical protein [Actinomycetes bacterium]